MNYVEAREYIDNAGQYGMVLGLDTMRELLLRLSNPQKKLSFIHIAGTNGKGSTGAYITEILRLARIKTGRYVSPALFCYEERIQLATKEKIAYISKENVARWMTKIKTVIDRMLAEGLPHPTPFEIETAMAFLEFEQQDCELVVLETGLGGRMDATNVIDTGVCQVFTAISRDHMRILGESLTQIATEKAGIIKPGIPVVSYEQVPEADKVLRKRAEELDCAFYEADFSKLLIEKMTLENTEFTYQGEAYLTSLLGENQPKNAAVAIETIKVLAAAGKLKNREEKEINSIIKSGINSVNWRGRFTVLSKKPVVIMDGAHNEGAAVSLAASLRQYFPGKKLTAVIGIFKDKEYDKVLKTTLPLMQQVYTLKPDNPRGLPAEELAVCARQYCSCVQACSSSKKALFTALQNATEETAAIIVYGSLSFLGEIEKAMEEYNEH